ncbi:MAG: (E)-4-hydroxy-3-methylbut-2-enyl-diphosphate synthase [Flavobacteriales bacterium]|nr:(E)-4-hydroxy-3-methylbut-2-enyl-diphosphate synthase [Flavobacteriales bacterium]
MQHDLFAYAGFEYCQDLFSYHRFITREVMIGSVGFGAKHPIRIQSMTTTDTMDTAATVEQSVRMIEAGCELVRITAPSKNEAENLKNIKSDLRARGYATPLVADIHFTPNAAEIAAQLVEKVRVNPGNYADKKKFEEIDYTDEAYTAELERIREKFTPLVLLCKAHHTAMRIGTNHGSLSDRILSRYGDTPLGMVESAMEFLRICEANNYQDIVISMKASNAQVMVQAYRLLVAKMKKENMNYPLHLGVTEAGDGEDGRIKSAVGIGALLEDGIGDTIRVSLTEDPEFEMPVARKLAERYEKRPAHRIPHSISLEELKKKWNPFEYTRRHSHPILNIGQKQVPVVIADLSAREKITAASLYPFGYHYQTELDKWNLSDQAVDYVFAGSNPVEFEIPGTLGIIYDSTYWKSHQGGRSYPLFDADDFFQSKEKHGELNFVSVDIDTLSPSFITRLKQEKNCVLVLETSNENGMQEQRKMFFDLLLQECDTPVIIKRNYQENDEEKFQLYASTDLGALLLDGFGDGIWINAFQGANAQLINRTAFGILQATRTRISKTEYISCPSCGRTLFDLQETTQKIRSVTDHLKGIKIGIMGCIVNGPGEMADADYGYVGTGVGKISLYKGKEVVRKNIASEEAVQALIDLIRENGDWVEKES